MVPCIRWWLFVVPLVVVVVFTLAPSDLGRWNQTHVGVLLHVLFAQTRRVDGRRRRRVGRRGREHAAVATWCSEHEHAVRPVATDVACLSAAHCGGLVHGADVAAGELGARLVGHHWFPFLSPLRCFFNNGNPLSVQPDSALCENTASVLMETRRVWNVAACGCVSRGGWRLVRTGG